MAQQKIELRKIRDFGENISDTFQFLRVEFKPLMSCLLTFVGIIIVAYAIVGGMNQTDMMNGIGLGRKGFGTFDRLNDYRDTFNALYFLTIGLGLLSFSAMVTVVASYLKLYDYKSGISPTIDEVWIQFRSYIFPVFFVHIIVLILIVIGTVFCIAPGLYLWTVFAPIVMIMVVEDASFGQAFTRCFSIIKDNFWLSLGIYIVVILISWFSSLIISLVVGIIVGVISYVTTKNMASTVGILTGVLSVFSYIFYTIYFVSVGLQYFNMVEKLDGEGLMRKLDNLGTTNPNSQIEEQY